MNIDKAMQYGSVNIMSLLTRAQRMQFDDDTDRRDFLRRERVKVKLPAYSVARQVMNRINVILRDYDATRPSEPWVY